MTYHMEDDMSLRREEWIPERRLHFALDSYVMSEALHPMVYGESGNPGTVTIKKLCDGLDITLGEFFSTPEFDRLEQEIK